MAVDYPFTDEEMVIDEGLGYPRAYAKICRDRGLGPYNHGPPFTFMPYAMQQNEVIFLAFFFDFFSGFFPFEDRNEMGFGFQIFFIKNRKLE